MTVRAVAPFLFLLIVAMLAACGGGGDDAENGTPDPGNGDGQETPTEAAEDPTPTNTPEATQPPEETATPAAETYTVQPGDTLSAIAQRFGVTVDALVEANDIANPNVINVGQVLIIPNGEAE